MANIPFLSFDAVDSLPPSKGSSSFSSNKNDVSDFSLFLKDAGHASEKFSFDTEKRSAAPVSSKIDDEPDVSVSNSSNSTTAEEGVEEISDDSSNDSGGVKDGNESESSTESEEVTEETVAGEKKKEGVHTPKKDAPTVLSGPVTMIFVKNIDTASAPVGEKKAEGEGATIGGAAKAASLKTPSEGQALQASATQTDSDADSHPGEAQVALQVAEAQLDSNGEKSKVAPQNTGIQVAGAQLDSKMANISIRGPQTGDPSVGQQIGGEAQAVKAPLVGVPQGAAAVSPEDIEIDVATVAQTLEVPEEAVVQITPDEAPTADESDPATAVKSNKNQSVAGGEDDSLPVAEVDADKGVEVSRVAGANSEVEGEEDVLQANTKTGNSAGPEAAAQRTAESNDAVISKDRIVAEIDGVAETKASQPAAGDRAEAALKLRLQQQVLEAASSRLRIATREGVSSARIRLDPPSLGRMDMRLEVQAGVLNAKVTVEHAWVKEAVTSNLKDLRDSLAEQGVEVESFSVDVNSGKGSGNSQSDFEGGAFGDELNSGDIAGDDPEIDAVLAEASAVATTAGRASLDFFA